MKENEKLTLRVDLNEKVSEELTRLKTKWGFNSYAETIRRLISDRAETEGLAVQLQFD